jgi:hypothetical protein
MVTASASHGDEPFTFTNLPKKVRFMVHDYFSDTVYQPLLESGESAGLFYMVQTLPVAPLQVGKFIYVEFRACSAKALDQPTPSVDKKSSLFERLPMELRLQVYDHLTVFNYRSLLKPEYLYYEVCGAPVALLCVSKFFNQEVSAYPQDYHRWHQDHPILLLCRLQLQQYGAHGGSILWASALLRLIERSHQ